MKATSFTADPRSRDAEPKTPDELPPAQARKARNIMRTMPEGSEPSQEVRERSRWSLRVISAAILVSFVGILLASRSSLSTVFPVLVITLAYGLGLMPLIGAALLRQRDRRESVILAQESS